MPELPEVQTVVDNLIAADLLGHSVRAASVYWPPSVEPMQAQTFCRYIANRTIKTIQRRGKYIVIELSEGWHLLIHLRMSGRIALSPESRTLDKHEHIVLNLDDGRELRFHDVRKFGRMVLTSDSECILKVIGPEPLGKEFSAKKLFEKLQSKHRILKSLLLDQTFIAGIGNIYCDEALWQARLHPLRKSSTLTHQEVGNLHRAIRRVLRNAIRNMGTSLGTGDGNFASTNGGRGRNQKSLRVYHRAGEPCLRCGFILERIIVAQRSTFLCPRCQQMSPSQGTRTRPGNAPVCSPSRITI